MSEEDIFSIKSPSLIENIINDELKIKKINKIKSFS